MSSKAEAYISEIVIIGEDGDRIAILKHFDGDSFTIDLETTILSANDAETIAKVLRNIEGNFIDFVTGEKFN